MISPASSPIRKFLNPSPARFYFGRTDSWCPLPYVEAMRSRMGARLRMELDGRSVPHAFVLGRAADMAETVAAWDKEEEQDS